MTKLYNIKISVADTLQNLKFVEILGGSRNLAVLQTRYNVKQRKGVRRQIFYKTAGNGKEQSVEKLNSKYGLT